MNMYKEIFQHFPVKELSHITKPSIIDFLCIHLEYLLAPHNMQTHTNWAYQCMLSNSDDEDIVLLASSYNSEERLSLTLSILRRVGASSLFYSDSRQLIDKLESTFPNDPLPQRITIYADNDPRDYDGEGELVENALQGKYWKEIPNIKPYGFFLSYLTHESLAYYLPGFFTFVFTDTKKYSDIDQRLLWLFFDDTSEWRNDLTEILKLLTQEQVNCLFLCALFVLANNYPHGLSM